MENLKWLETICPTNEGITVIISDNCSNDFDDIQFSNFVKHTTLNVTISRMDKNIGLEKNAVSLLKSAKSPYIMYLGDDDFLHKDYLTEVLSQISEHRPGVIIPSFIGVSKTGRILTSRSLGLHQHYPPGIHSSVKLFLLGHQLSGIVLQRDALYKKYNAHPEHHNIYPFISFVGLNTKKNGAILLGTLPVRVTLGQVKDWSYNQDGLFGEKAKNIPIIESRTYLRFFYEFFLIYQHFFTIRSVYKKSDQKLSALLQVFLSKDVGILSKSLLPVQLTIWIFLSLMTAIHRRLRVAS